MKSLLKTSLLIGLCIRALLPERAALAAGDGGGIAVSGRALLKDGRVWVPKGFTMVAFVAPESAMNPAYHTARMSFGPVILDRAHSLGADLLRFQVSQAGLDPLSSIYEPKYLDEIVAAVRLARGKGFSVIVSMQWEAPSGLKGQPWMPSDITRRAWSRIAPAFAGDPYVMLELFNEPGMWETNPAAWPAWRSGMQSLVDSVRGAGARNVLILDGIHGAHVLKGAPSISDPLNRLAYAVHPYIAERALGPGDWDRDFGNFASNHAVLTTEWNATSTLDQCRPDAPRISREFIAYLEQRKIGLVLWALDLHGTLFGKDDRPIGFKGFQCGKWGAGAAWISIRHFRDDDR